MDKQIIFREITAQEMTRALFNHFIRHQIVDKCRRKVDGEWTILSDPFVDEWSEEEYVLLVKCLQNTIKTEGFVYGAFVNEQLKGFVSVESEPIGKNKEYLDLTSIHVSEDMRGMGIGRKLFAEAAHWAKLHGGQKLYISAHSAIESQEFYKSMGCVEAKEYSKMHVEAEPCDCQLEYVL